MGKAHQTRGNLDMFCRVVWQVFCVAGFCGQGFVAGFCIAKDQDAKALCAKALSIYYYTQNTYSNASNIFLAGCHLNIPHAPGIQVPLTPGLATRFAWHADQGLWGDQGLFASGSK